MKLSKEKLREILVVPGHISQEQFDAGIAQSKKEHTPPERFFVVEGLISDENLGRAIAEALGYRFTSLKDIKISEKLLRYIPEIVARSQRAVVFERTVTVLKVATSDPDNYTFFKLLEKKNIGYRVEAYFATELAVEGVLKYYQLNVSDRVTALLEELKSATAHEEGIVQLVNFFLDSAYNNEASDIHIEPQDDHISVRYRIDGILHQVATYPKTLHHRVVLRIKILAQLRTDEHSIAQDGRFSHDFYVNQDSKEANGKGSSASHKKFDIRVSLLPITEGENVVMRILVEGDRRLNLKDLGFSDSDLQKVELALRKSHGVVLAVGPTGSGKTTTLYAIVQLLNKPEVNIMTIEDPVEYDIAHVQQTQVSAKKNLTFVTGLRSIVRQDPDIIMVGEIRDNETGSIAINAGMTGHLVLSTLHANDVATTFPRLSDMGVEPYLIASSLRVVIAQRLIRKICDHCRESYFLNAEELKLLTTQPQIVRYLIGIAKQSDPRKIRVYRGGGCKVCGNSGYNKRTGIFEVMEVTDELRSLIGRGMIESEIRKQGIYPMLYDGVKKVYRGVTTIDEILRVTSM